MRPRQKVLEVYYQDSLKSIFYKGIQRVREKSKIDSAINKVLFLTTGKTLTETVAGTSVSFYVENEVEFKRVRDLMGESAIIEDVMQEVTSNDVFFDIGANIGVYSLFVSKDSGCSVVAFEPHPANVRRFEDNLSLNYLRADLEECALWDKNETLQLNLGESELPGGGKHSVTYGNKNKTTAVKAQRGDDYIYQDSVPFPNVLKIDVEGAELHVLSGLQKTLADDRCRTVYCEVHPGKMNDDIGEIEDVLSSAGFEIARLIGDPDGYGLLKATKQIESGW